MLFNLIGSLILIGLSFLIRHLAEETLATSIITWSMFGIGIIFLIATITFFGRTEHV